MPFSREARATGTAPITSARRQPQQVARMRLGEAPDTSLLDPIETASRDELAALQTRRLSVTLRRAYDAVPAMRAKFDQHGVHPDDFHSSRRSEALSLHRQV